MTEATKVISESPAENVVPEVLNDTTPESTPGSETELSHRESVRLAMEEKVEQGNVGEVERLEETVAPEVKPTEEVASTEDALKKNIQKRINKLTAQKKTAEERLAELEAENERLRNAPKTEVVSDPSKQNAEPTIEQCEAYIIKCREEGDVKNEMAAMRYMIKLEKEAAIKEVEKKQEEQYRKTTEVSAKQQSDWINLNRDYESDNPDLDLKNQNGRLYKEAMEIYQDPKWSAAYSDPDKIAGFRKAVHDTYRYLLEGGLHKKTVTPPSETLDTTPRVRVKAQLADPSTDSGEETSQVVSKNLSDADKVKEEILNRRKNRTLR